MTYFRTAAASYTCFQAIKLGIYFSSFWHLRKSICTYGTSFLTPSRVVELFSFLVLNIGLPVVDSLGGWERFSDGLLQSLSVRASGFAIVTISDMAPSVLFLYIVCSLSAWEG